MTDSEDHVIAINKALATLVVIGMLAQLAVIVYVAVSFSNAKNDVVAAQRDGCERIKLDRATNAEGWRIAEDARRADGQIDVADKYAALAKELEGRSQIVCKEVYP